MLTQLVGVNKTLWSDKGLDTGIEGNEDAHAEVSDLYLLSIVSRRVTCRREIVSSNANIEDLIFFKHTNVLNLWIVFAF